MLRPIANYMPNVIEAFFLPFLAVFSRIVLHLPHMNVSISNTLLQFRCYLALTSLNTRFSSGSEPVSKRNPTRSPSVLLRKSQISGKFRTFHVSKRNVAGGSPAFTLTGNRISRRASCRIPYQKRSTPCQAFCQNGSRRACRGCHCVLDGVKGVNQHVAERSEVLQRRADAVAQPF